MKRKTAKKQKGVSLLEVVIVLAISSLMLLGVFQWLNTRKRALFTTDMTTLINDIKGVQTAVLANEGPKQEGATCESFTTIAPTDEIVGQAIFFDKAPSMSQKYKKYKLRSPSGNSSVTCYEVEEINLPSSVSFDNIESMDVTQGGTIFQGRGTIVFLRSTNQAYYFQSCNPLAEACLGRPTAGFDDSDFTGARQNSGTDLFLRFKDLNDARFTAKINFNLRNNKAGLSFQ